MKRFDVVSLDMFGTLADIDGVKYRVWKQFLGDDYTEALAEQYWDRGSVLVMNFFDEEIIGQGRYVPPRKLFEECYSVLFREIGIELGPVDGAEILASGHAHSGVFHDVQPFFDSVSGTIPVCLSSDTDLDMLGSLRDMYPFDHVFTSEELGAYKSGSNGRFFSEVVTHYGIEPERILHVGDSLSDIAGAQEAGIRTCWLNRKGAKWGYGIKPDFEVETLTDLARILRENESEER